MYPKNFPCTLVYVYVLQPLYIYQNIKTPLLRRLQCLLWLVFNDVYISYDKSLLQCVYYIIVAWWRLPGRSSDGGKRQVHDEVRLRHDAESARAKQTRLPRIPPPNRLVTILPKQWLHSSDYYCHSLFIESKWTAGGVVNTIGWLGDAIVVYICFRPNEIKMYNYTYNLPINFNCGRVIR